MNAAAVQQLAPLSHPLFDVFLLGFIVACSLVAALFFLRFWKKSRDRLFLFFSAAFWLLGVNWLALALSNRDEPNTILYVVRLLAFVLILIGIWDKNRARGRRQT